MAKLQRALQASAAAADVDAADAAGMDVEASVVNHMMHASSASGEGAAVQPADDDLQAQADQQLLAA